MGDNLTTWNPTILETKLIPPLILQVDTTRVMTDPTPNLVAQIVPVALTDQEVQVVLAVPEVPVAQAV